MMCEKLRAFLDDELSAIGRLAMSAHLRLCGRCRLNAAEWQRLRRQIEQLEDEPVPPALSERVHAGALLAAASARMHGPSPAAQRWRSQGVVTMRRAVMAVVCLGVLAGVALWQLPGRRSDAGLAAVAEAMANVESVHFTGSELDYATGERCPFEGWVKGRKFRMVTEGKEDVADDGERLVTVSTTNDFVAALISPSGDYVALSEGATYLDLFRGGRVFLEQGMEVPKWEAVTLPDGRQAKKATLGSPGTSGSRVVLTVDADTDLLLGMEEYVDGKLADSIDRVEYDVEVPDSIFEIDIPENAVVTDKTAPPSQASAGNWKRVQAAANRLSAKGAVVFWSTSPGAQAAGGTGGSGFHPGLWFHPLDNNGTVMLYTPQNTYVIFGRVLVEGKKYRFRRVVTNEEFAAPGPPVVTIEQRKEQENAERARSLAEWKRYVEQHPERVAKAKELRAAGGRLVGSLSSGSRCSGYDRRLWFECVSDFVEIFYMPSSNSYYVVGKARVSGIVPEQIIEDGELKMSSPPEKQVE